MDLRYGEHYESFRAELCAFLAGWEGTPQGARRAPRSEPQASESQ